MIRSLHTTLRQKLITPFIAILVVSVGHLPAQADLIAYWNFNDLSTVGGVPNNANQTSYLPVSGTGSLDLVGWSSRGGSTAPHGISNFLGSAINAINPDPAGSSLALQASNASTGTPNNGATLVIQVNLALFIDPILTFASQRSATGFNSNQVAWSIDGTNYTDFGAAFDPTTSFALRTFDFSSISALDRATTAYFRVTFNDASNNSGNNRLDNFQLNATSVPEPSTICLFGAICISGLLLRRRPARKTK